VRRLAEHAAQALRGQRHKRHEGRHQWRAQSQHWDGWWAEGYTGSNGWLIDGKADATDYAAVDAADAEALYRLLENEVVPAFYEVDGIGVPRRWLQVVKQSIRTVMPAFAARRMVKQYVEQMYTPALGLTRQHD